MNKCLTTFCLDEEWAGYLASREIFRQPGKSRAGDLLTTFAYEGGELVPQARAADQIATMQAGILVLNIKGALSNKSSWWSQFFGFSTYEDISEILNAAVSNSKINTIIFAIQSPGGDAMGAPEISKEIYDARASKRIIAIADPYAFSAAYWIGSSADEFYLTKSGQVGSVGAYALHLDYSEQLKSEGVKPTFIYAGDKKVDGNSLEPISESAKVDLQTEIDDIYQMFVSDVARNRKTSVENVIQNFGKGGRVMAKDALSLGMVDNILTLKELLALESGKLTESLQSKARAKAAFNYAKTLTLLES